jgi:hypothetical protein
MCVTYRVKILLNNQYTLKNEGQEANTDLVHGKLCVGWENINGECEGWCIWLMYLYT